MLQQAYQKDDVRELPMPELQEDLRSRWESYLQTQAWCGYQLDSAGHMNGCAE